MPYQAPGDAFSSAFANAEIQRQAMQRQAMLDNLAVDREKRLAAYEQVEQRQAEEALDLRRKEADDRETDRRTSAFEKTVSGMGIGDIPDVSLIKEADDLHMGHMFPPDPTTGVRRYVGSSKQREEQKDRDEITAAGNDLAKATPGTPDYQKALIRYGMATKKPLTPAEVGAGRGMAGVQGAIRPMLLLNPRTGAITQAGTGKLATPEQINDPNAKIERLSEPDPAAAAARDIATKDREATHLDGVRKDAYTEYDKWLQPVEEQIKSAEGASIALTQKTAQADAVLAPMMLKAFIVSGSRSSGVRMTQSEINNYTGGATKWEQLKSALNLWSSDPQHARFTDDQRSAMQRLLKAYTQKAYDLQDKANKIRRQITDAESPKEVNRLRDELDDLMHGRSEQPNTTPDIDSQVNDILARARGKK